MAVSAALEREHQQIDAGLEAFLIDLRGGRVDAAGLSTALEGLRKHIYLEERILLPDGDTAALTAVSRLLLDQLAVHNSKEEQVIYRAADTGLEPEQAAAVTEFIETGLLPDSWECLEAG
ncbi:MAG: hemerythrin domain-containing protein [Actinomycetota bacterium]|nr:hemerythrin domain-containing protein [Actinomycetota bacterium]